MSRHELKALQKQKKELLELKRELEQLELEKQALKKLSKKLGR